MNEVILIFGMMAVTFGIRYPPMAIIGRIELPKPALRALRYVPVAVLTAITVPAAVMPDDKIYIAFDNAYLIGAIVAIIVAWKTRNLLWTILIGMAVFLVWRAITG